MQVSGKRRICHSGSLVAKGHGIGWLLMKRMIEFSKHKDVKTVQGQVLSDEYHDAYHVRPNAAFTFADD